MYKVPPPNTCADLRPFEKPPPNDYHVQPELEHLRSCIHLDYLGVAETCVDLLSSKHLNKQWYRKGHLHIILELQSVAFLSPSLGSLQLYVWDAL